MALNSSYLGIGSDVASAVQFSRMALCTKAGNSRSQQGIEVAKSRMKQKGTKQGMG